MALVGNGLSESPIPVAAVVTDRRIRALACVRNRVRDTGVRVSLNLRFDDFATPQLREFLVRSPDFMLQGEIRLCTFAGA